MIAGGKKSRLYVDGIVVLKVCRLQFTFKKIQQGDKYQINKITNPSREINGKRKSLICADVMLT